MRTDSNNIGWIKLDSSKLIVLPDIITMELTLRKAEWKEFDEKE